MTLIRKLASALCLVLLFSNYSNAQVDSTTGNLINFTGTPTATTSNWNNGVYVNQLCFQYGQPGNCGPNPSVRAASGNINFSYGTVDLNQIVNINSALAAGGTGVQLSGFNFSFMAKNGNGWDDGRQDYLAAYVKLYGSGGNLVSNYDYSSQTNRKYNWTNFSFNETFAAPQLASQFSTAQVGFVGRDNNFWAGNYGPEIYNVAFSLKYRVDPCALNPAYSPTCANFSTVSTSGNLVPYPNGYAVYGDSINQSYAINTALANAGSAAQIHGFRWGYVANANGPYCAFSFIVCWDQRDPSVTTNVNITNSAGASLYNVTREYKNGYNTTEYSYLFPSSQTMSTLGNFNFTATTNDSAYVGSMWSRALYTVDPCAVNPLSSTTCPGYAVAYAKTLILGSTVASASAPIAPSPALAQAAPELAQASPDPAQPATAQQSPQPQQQAQQGPAPAADPAQNPSVASADPAQPSPTQPGPAPTGSPAPAGGPPQTSTASASSSSSGPATPSAGPSKLAMSVLKSAQEKDKATQNAAVASAAKTLENATQSSQASSNAAISMNQDMSANSAVAAANFSSQTTQASQQTAVQPSQQQQTTQFSTQTQQASKMGPQVQQQQQDSQQAMVQSTSIVQYQPPQQQESQQSQTQSSSSVVKLLPPQQQETQQTQTQTTAGMMPPQQNTYTAPQQQQQDSQSTQVSMLKPPTQPVIEVQQQASTGTGLTVGRNMFSFNTLTLSNNSSQSITQPIQPTYQPRIDTRQFEVETPQMPVASFTGSRAGNPLSEIMMQQRFELMQNNISQSTSSVNKNVQPNELASGVDIASIAGVPAGFSAYSFVLKDAAFYEPKEVYKNQRTVDNERVLRGLTRGSDSLHQQMVDQQYKIGN